jgi:dihydroorotase/allantoinase
MTDSNTDDGPADTVFLDCEIVTAADRSGPGMGIAVTDGKIAAVGRAGALPPAEREVDLDGQVLAPGVVDAHVHTREPGHEYKEDWESATRAAAAGGVTTVIAMPNTDPAIDRAGRVQAVFERAAATAHVDYQTHVVVTSENATDLAALAEAGIAGFKIFLGITFGEIEAPTDGEMYAAMEQISGFDKRLGFHEENDEIRAHLEETFRAEGRHEAIAHNESRPPVAEAEAVSRVCLLGETVDCPLHMFHLSSGSAAEVLAEWQAKGVDATAETCPHYLWFTDEVVRERGTVARVQPPLRTADERARLWAGLDDGTVGCIATDHAPHTDEEKGVGNPEKSVWETPGGFVGVETQVPAMLTFVDEGRLSLPEWVGMHSTAPARTWGLYPEKGSLVPGTDADFLVVDPDREWQLDRDQLHSKSTATVWDGEEFTGAVTATVVRGHLVYDGTEILSEPGHGKRADAGPVR